MDNDHNYKESDSITYCLKAFAKENTRPLKEKENFLQEMRESFIEFLSEVVVKDFKKKYSDNDLNAENLVKYYFEDRKKYKKILEEYDLVVEQTEGIISDVDFINELNNEKNINKDDMVRIGE